VDDEQELSFRDLFELIRRGFLWALLAGIVVAAATYFISRSQPPIYQATATLILSQPSSDLNRFGVSLVSAPAIDVNAYREAARSSPVLSNSLRALGADTVTPKLIKDFEDLLSIRTQENRLSSMLYLDFRAPNPATAQAYANALAEQLLAWDVDRATRNLQTIVSTLEAQIISLDTQIAELELQDSELPAQRDSLANLRAEQTVSLNSARALLNSAVGALEIMEPATRPTEPVAPRPLRNAALAFVLAVFVTYGVILLRSALDTRVRSSEELQEISGLPVLAEFPKQSGKRRLPREASSYLRTNVLFATADVDPKVLLVTGHLADQGKSSVALSLAESFTRNGYRTLLIDADLRKPVLHTEYRIKPHFVTSLPDMLHMPDDELEPHTLRFSTKVSMDIIPTFASQKNATELLTRGMKRVLDRLAPNYDVVIIDSAPVLPVADTLAIAPHTDGIIFAASLLDSDRRSITAALELLQRLGLNLLGIVATNVPESARSGQSAVGYGYGYGYGAAARSEADPAPRA